MVDDKALPMKDDRGDQAAGIAPSPAQQQSILNKPENLQFLKDFEKRIGGTGADLKLTPFEVKPSDADHPVGTYLTEHQFEKQQPNGAWDEIHQLSPQQVERIKQQEKSVQDRLVNDTVALAEKRGTKLTPDMKKQLNELAGSVAGHLDSDALNKATKPGENNLDFLRVANDFEKSIYQTNRDLHKSIYGDRNLSDIEQTGRTLSAADNAATRFAKNVSDFIKGLDQLKKDDPKRADSPWALLNLRREMFNQLNGLDPKAQELAIAAAGSKLAEHGIKIDQLAGTSHEDPSKGPYRVDFDNIKLTTPSDKMVVDSAQRTEHDFGGGEKLEYIGPSWTHLFTAEKDGSVTKAIYKNPTADDFNIKIQEIK